MAMSTKKYKYVGTVRTAAANQLMFSGCEYDLPENDKHVKSLVKKGLLVPVVPSNPKPSNSK